jgi:FtsP/CotA-like multicopper oxidase with cupredoxin domain
LEDCIVAMRFDLPPLNGSGKPGALPFAVPLSNRLLAPTIPAGVPVDPFTFTNVDTVTGNPIVPAVQNVPYDFAWEYVWHCHLLGHEENDFMRPIIVDPTPMTPAP